MSFLQRLNPSIVPTSLAERARASLGALVGIAATGLVSTLALGSDVNLPLLIAPMGASAVLLFAAPTSPLAQPWSILGGNLVAALCGVTCALVIPEPLIAASLAVALTIGCMLMLNCLHPPSGAVALTAVLGGAGVTDLGYWFVLSPVGVNTVLILAIALVFNNATGRVYPHLAPARGNPLHGTADPPPSHRAGPRLEDVEAAIRDYDEVVTTSPEELDELLHRAQIRAFTRMSPDLVCADIMSRDVLTVKESATLRAAWRVLAAHHLDELPVVDDAGDLKGMVRLSDFVRHSALADNGRLRDGLASRLRAAVGRSDLPRTAGEIMSRRVQSALPETPIGLLVSPMADQGVHLMPVVDADNRVVGVITQSDLLGALFQERFRDMAMEAGGAGA